MREVILLLLQVEPLEALMICHVGGSPLENQMITAVSLSETQASLPF